MTVDARTSAVASSGGWEWTLLLPPGWTSFPLEPVAARAAIKALLDRQLSGLPRDQVVRTRIDLDRSLRALVAEARDAGATALHAQVELVRGMPVSASLVVSVIPLVEDDAVMTAALGGALAEGTDVVQSGSALLGDLPALRRHRRWKAAIDIGADVGVDAAAEPLPEGVGPAPQVWHTGVDWLVPTPDGDELLVLAFGTINEPVAAELVGLFDAIASSLDLRARG